MMLDQLREPRVINMAAEIACLNVRVPNARNYEAHGKQQHRENICSKEAGGAAKSERWGTLEGELARHSGGGSASILHGTPHTTLFESFRTSATRDFRPNA